MLRPLIVLATILMCGKICSAAAEKTWFLGEARLSSEAGKSLGSQVLLVEKTQDPEKNLIIERAIVVNPDGTAEQHTMSMTVTRDSFTLKDDANTTSGSGKLFGPAWQWTYWKGSFHSSNGVRIEDENFLSDPSVGVARKKVIGPNGKVMMYMDVTMKQITPQTFEVLAAALLKKP
jgi:hypothetical protein